MQRPDTDPLKSVKVILLAVLLMMVSACVPIDKSASNQADPRQRLDRLIALNDYGERAFAYHQFCIGEAEPMDERFLDNFEMIANLLFDEFVETMRWQPQYAVDQVLERRRNIQQALSTHYLTQGCQSAEGVDAKNYYAMLGEQSINSIERYLSQ